VPADNVKLKYAREFKKQPAGLEDYMLDTRFFARKYTKMPTANF